MGYSPVIGGVNRDVTVCLGPQVQNGKARAVLLRDSGKVGTFEFPGSDVREPSGGKRIDTIIYAV